MSGPPSTAKPFSPKSSRSKRITDYFKPIHHSERPKTSKRVLNDDEPDCQPTKKLRVYQDRDTVQGFKTVRLWVGVDVAGPRKSPSHTRLIDQYHTKVETVDKEVAHSEDQIKISLADRLRNISRGRRTPTPNKRPSSVRLLDDVDGGLMDSVVGRFETTPCGEEDENDKKPVEASNIGDNTSALDTSADKAPVGGIGSTNNRDRYRTPSPRRSPTLPENHGSQGSSTCGQPANSAASHALPGAMVDLSPGSSPVSFRSSPGAMASSTSSQ